MEPRKFRFLNPESPRRPPDYGSRNLQLKLLGLFASLLVVLWCMQEAAKPENWRWLAPDSAANPATDPQAPAGPDQPGSAAIDLRTELGGGRSAGGAGKADLARARSSASQDPRDPPVHLDWTLEAIFWRLAIDRLSPEERFVLVIALDHWASDDEPLASLIDLTPQPAFRSALQRLTNLRDDFQRVVTATAARNLGMDTAIDLDLPEEEQDLPSFQLTEPTRASLFELPPTINLDQAQAIHDQSRWLQTYWAPLRSASDGEPRSGEHELAEATPQSPPDQSLEVGQDSELERHGDSNGDPGSPPLGTDSGGGIGFADGGAYPKTAAQIAAGQVQWQIIRREFWDPQLFGFVTDGSRLGRPEERAAWLRLVQKATVHKDDATADPRPDSAQAADPMAIPQVARQNLMGQPEQFRGQQVHIRGTLRRVEQRRQSDPAVAAYLAQNDYLVAWIQPGVSGQGPYCIYCLADPELMRMAQQSSDLRHPVLVDAWFFKLHAYTSGDGRTQLCPLLVAHSLTWQPLSEAAAPVVFSLGQWIAAITVVLLLAVGLAVSVWLATRYRSANPLGRRQRSRAQVDWLQQQDVREPGQALRDLADQELPTAARWPSETGPGPTTERPGKGE